MHSMFGMALDFKQSNDSFPADYFLVISSTIIMILHTRL